MALLEAHGLEVAIGGVSICQGLDLTIEAGSCWGILGRNGVGKTTLLHTLAGLRPAQAGALRLEERPLAAWPRRERARRIGVLLQDHQDPFPATVLETVLSGRHPHLHAWQWEGETELAIAREALLEMELQGFGQRALDTLSGGERRRVGLATLLTQAPRLALLDEPANHLDLHHQVTLLERLQGRLGGGALVMTLHDVNLAARFCDHLLLLFGNGEARAGSAPELLDNSLLSRLYGHPVRCLDDGRTRCFLPA